MRPLASLVVVALASGGANQAPNVSTNRLVSAGADYVASYQEQFAFLLADEATVQRVVSGRPGSEAAAGTRATRSEVFITYLDGRRHWTTVRDVAEVDGVAASTREDLAELIATEDTDRLARRLFALNARYNIGRVARNFNDPMLALLPLNRAHRPRFTFDVENIDRTTAGFVLATLSFRERERPTLVRSTTGAPVYARGEMAIDAATGIVRHTRITFRYDDIEAELATRFVREERLGLWVPATFTERYESTRDSRREVTTVESTYSNYRRFEVRARMRTP